MKGGLGRGFAAVVLLFHAALMMSVVAPCQFVSIAPFAAGDFGAHFHEAHDISEHLRHLGSFWGYNPSWMAGFPEGIIGLVDNKLFSVVLALAPRSAQPLVFNLTALLCIFAPPVALLAAAHLAGVRDEHATGAALGALLATFTVPICTFFWSGGALSFFLAGALAVPALIAGAFFVAGRGRAIPAIFFGVLSVFVHPGSLVMIGPGLLASLITADGPRSPAIVRLVLLGCCLAVPVLPVFSAGWALASQLGTRAGDDFLQGGARRLVGDWVLRLFRAELHWKGGAGGLVALALLAATGWERFKREIAQDADTRVLRRVLLVSLAWTVFLAYGSSWLYPFRPLEPYRFLIPFAFFLCLPAGSGLIGLVEAMRSKPRRSLLLGLLVLAISIQGGWALLSRVGLGPGLDAAEPGLIAFLEHETTEKDRIAIECDWNGQLAYPGSSRRILVRRFALLPLQISREFVGQEMLSPFTRHRYARLGDGWFLGHRISALSDKELAVLFNRYAISWVLTYRPETTKEFAAHSNLLEPVTQIADVTAFRVRSPETSRLLTGSGQVHAGPDRIEIHAASGEFLVLKYHWLPTFRTVPPVSIEEVPQSGAPVGFVGVHPRGRPDIAIFQGTSE